MKENENRGFSLIELIVVIAIMAVLIGVLAPQYIKYVEKSRVSVDDETADALLNIGYLIASDEEYFPSISSGNKIVFTRNGISVVPAGNTVLTNALDEFTDNWRNDRVKSKAYASQSYVVEFQGGASASTFRVTGSWQP